jgi:hypothetical protein
MTNPLELLGVGKHTTLPFWSEPHQFGTLFHLGEHDISKVKANGGLEGGRTASTAAEIVEAATNKVGLLYSPEGKLDAVDFLVDTYHAPFVLITMKVFVGLEEDPKKPESAA